MSLLLFYKSIFIGATFRKVANSVIVVLCAWIIAFFFVTLFQDHPISRNWGTVGTTVNFSILYIVENLTDIVLDLFILCMPIPVIRSLQISTRRKWLLGGVFWLGALSVVPDHPCEIPEVLTNTSCVVASTVRFYYFVLFRQEYNYQSKSNAFTGMESLRASNTPFLASSILSSTF